MSYIEMPVQIHKYSKLLASDKAYAADIPAVWNSLPEKVRSSSLLQLFWFHLKAELF